MTAKRICLLSILCLMTACSSAVRTAPGSPPPATELAPRAADPLPPTTSAASSTRAVRAYPLLPLPPGAVYFGPGRPGEDPAVIEVEIAGDAPPFTPEAYSSLFERYGWTQLTTACGSTVSTPQPTMTDTALLGVYSHGIGSDAPLVCVTKNMMAEGPGAWLTLAVYHCGLVRDCLLYTSDAADEL